MIPSRGNMLWKKPWQMHINHLGDQPVAARVSGAAPGGANSVNRLKASG
tara:strand:+ start:24 stop:170 length:147 start_codon:yes stop_codon:yes gene_type:complete